MKPNLEQVYYELTTIKDDLDDLRSTYKGVSKSYALALKTLNDLTLHSSEAAKRAAKSTEQSRIAAMNAVIAAKEVAANPTLVAVVEAAVITAVAAALAAVESAAAAAAASAAAATAVSHQADESLVKASTEAAKASKMAADSAAEAVKLSIQARDVADSVRVKA